MDVSFKTRMLLVCYQRYCKINHEDRVEYKNDRRITCVVCLELMIDVHSGMKRAYNIKKP